MQVLIMGGTGQIGHRVAYWLARDQHRVIVFSRNSQAKSMPPNVNGARWDGYSGYGWKHLVDSDTVIINLAGHPLATSRVTEQHRRRVLDSRLDTTQAVAEVVAEAAHKPHLVVQASTAAIYGSRGDEEITEKSPIGTGWVSEMCVEWEQAAAQIPGRVAILRIGTVLSRRGAFFTAMERASRFAMRHVGSGDQWLSWVHVDDIAFAIRHLMAHPTATGKFNLTAPEPIINADFMAWLGHEMRHPRLIGSSGALMRFALREQTEVALADQRVLPARLLASGFRFTYPTLEHALVDLVRS